MPCFVGLSHGGREPPPGLDVLSADVDEPLRRVDRPRRDQHALDEGVGVPLEKVPILEGSRLAFVGVDHEVDRARVVLRDERPLGPGREAGAAEAPEVCALDLVDDHGGLHRLRLRPALVASCLYVRSNRVRVGPPEVAREDRFAAHASPPRIWSSFAGVRFIS